MSISPRLFLEPDDIHIWWIDLNGIEDDATAILPEHERARAERLRSPRDRARWTRGRSALRQILARYTGTDAGILQLESGILGKPVLAGGSSLRFSLSHALERAVLAVTWEREVGVDLEVIDPELNVSSMLAVVCNQDEADRIDALPPAIRAEAFLTCWTLKEAYLKGIGAGLSRDPRPIELEERQDGWVVVRDSSGETDGQQWSLRLLESGPGWVTAVAILGKLHAIKVYHYQALKRAPMPSRASPDRSTWSPGSAR